MYRIALQSIFGLQFTKWFVAITVTQYHFMYYLSRPLPNIMAMPLVLLALFGWLRRSYVIFIWSSAAAIIIFRAELAMLLGLFLLYDIANMKLTVQRLLKIAVPAGIFFLALTITVDSIFWGRLLWPEGEVFYFNTFLNKSSQWGTSPFLWYFYSALPRGLALSYILIPLGLFWDARVRALTVPGILFVLFFSFLPHKELRFIIYVFPLLNVSAAAACHRIWENRAKTSWNSFLALAVLGHLALNAIFSMFLLCVAGSNYPGGLAITRLHRLEKDAPQPVYVHIDVLTAQTGVSRFTQTNRSWTYSKQENLTIDDPEMLKFTHLLMEAKSKYSPNIKPYLKTHDILDSVDGFSHIALNYNMIPPIRIKTKPTIFIMKRKPNIEYDAKKVIAKRNLDEPVQIDNNENLNNNIMMDESLEYMEPIFDDIVESLEAFGKPLESTQEDISVTESIPDTVIDIDREKEMNNLSIEVDIDESSNIPINDKDFSNVPEPSLEISKEQINSIKMDENDNDGRSKELKIEETQDIESDLEDTTRVHSAQAEIDHEVDKQETVSVKEAVKKLIQEKMEEVKSKKNLMNDTEDNLIVGKHDVKLKKKVTTEKVDVSKPTKAGLNKDSKDSLTERHKRSKQRVLHVKDSIRNIINQFKEFEKDLASEDPENLRRWSDDEFSDYSAEIEEVGAVSLEENINEMDRFIVETQDPNILKDAKENLKEIIDQFKELKNELTSEEDDQFDKISADYMNRPISETLMLFSEALKDLVQKRKIKATKLTLEISDKVDNNDVLPSENVKVVSQLPKKTKLKQDSVKGKKSSKVEKVKSKPLHDTIVPDSLTVNIVESSRKVDPGDIRVSFIENEFQNSQEFSSNIINDVVVGDRVSNENFEKSQGSGKGSVNV
ncbi:probable Dol-P-Man:Man(7)GlcNAc(2)-PP-Dol alpha-1,6-mannosyltransferase isoform X2 [Cephus cinctus]|nr:probable Dol-P-Man:Man(7)GlcNAc(2)-PP-Dol alpha-1,6-mannosyltransferase isoform X2 [Cephus cinctus]